jgi:hypothetical protein
MDSPWGVLVWSMARGATKRCTAADTRGYIAKLSAVGAPDELLLCVKDTAEGIAEGRRRAGGLATHEASMEP